MSPINPLRFLHLLCRLCSLSNTLPRLAALCAFGCIGIGAQSAVVITLQQGANSYTGATDATIFEDLTGHSAGGFPYLYAGVTQTGHPRRALLKFDLAGAIPTGAQITSATMQLYTEFGRPGNYPCALHRLTQSWNEGVNPLPPGSAGGRGAPADEGDSTWSHISYSAVGGGTTWTAPGGDFNTAPSATGTTGEVGTYVRLSSSALAQDIEDWVATPGTNHGWILLVDENDTQNAKRYYSSEAADPRRPTLFIEYNIESSAKNWMLY